MVAPFTRGMLVGFICLGWLSCFCVVFFRQLVTVMFMVVMVVMLIVVLALLVLLVAEAHVHDKVNDGPHRGKVECYEQNTNHHRTFLYNQFLQGICKCMSQCHLYILHHFC